MKKTILIALGIIGFISVIVAAMGFFSQNKPPKQKAFTDSKGFVLIELFTSEGCSSCPPADGLLAKIKEEKHSNVYLLAYHVDYWDRLGWKDSFSKPEWSERQKIYAQKFSEEGVYTPQMVINGSVAFVGSNEKRIRQVLNDFEPLAENRLVLSIVKSSNNLLNLTYSYKPNAPSVLNIVLVQDKAFTYVKKGENKGLRLDHVNIVKAITSIGLGSPTGSLLIPLDQKLNEGEFKIIAFVQQKNNLEVTSAMEVAVE